MPPRNNIVHVRPEPLPALRTEWERKLKSERTLNDYVEDLHLMLLETENNAEYRAFLEAVWDSDAVEGSLAIDNSCAARMIRDKAGTIQGNPVASKKLDTIVKSLGVVLRRYEFSRNERRHTVDHVRVPSPPATNGSDV